MRHNVFGKKLNRDIKQRRALFKSLVQSMVRYGKIETTYPKAKAVRGLIEKLVTRARIGDNNARRHIEAFFVEKELVEKMMKIVGPAFKTRPGGYIRIIKLGKRIGDTAESVRIEWTEEIEKPKSQSPKSKAKIEKKVEVKEEIKDAEVVKDVKPKKAVKPKAKKA